MHANEKTVDETVCEPSTGAGRRRDSIKLNDQAKNRLGLHLRAMYDELVAQPVPDRFRDLIAQLDAPKDTRADLP